MATREEDYSQWAVDRLAERVRTLEKELRDARAKFDCSVLTWLHRLT